MSSLIGESTYKYCLYHYDEDTDVFCRFIKFNTEKSPYPIPGKTVLSAEIEYLEDCKKDGIGKGSRVTVHPNDIQMLSDLKANDYIQLISACEEKGYERLSLNDDDRYQKDDQTIKADAGKPKLTLVPQQIIFDIAKVREYGVKKYGESESWKSVDIQRYRDAAYRHFLAYLNDPQGNDEESGLTHLSHLACNIAFLCELENNRKESKS